MDESGIDENEEIEYGYAPKGAKCYGEKKSRRTHRTTFISAYSPTGKTFHAPFCFEGYTNAEIFQLWLRQCLIPETSSSTTIILDNASFHKTNKVKELLEERGIKLLFLPTYSPDLNPIEQQWAILKKKIRRRKKSMEFEKAIQTSFQEMG